MPINTLYIQLSITVHYSSRANPDEGGGGREPFFKILERAFWWIVLAVSPTLLWDLYSIYDLPLPPPPSKKLNLPLQSLNLCITFMIMHISASHHKIVTCDSIIIYGNYHLLEIRSHCQTFLFLFVKGIENDSFWPILTYLLTICNFLKNYHLLVKCMGFEDFLKIWFGLNILEIIEFSERYQF